MRRGKEIESEEGKSRIHFAHPLSDVIKMVKTEMKSKGRNEK